MHHCPHCEYHSPSSWNLKRHLKTHDSRTSNEEDNGTRCKWCARDFSLKHNRKRHEKSCPHKPAESRDDCAKVAQICSPVAQICSPVAQVCSPVAQICSPVAQFSCLHCFRSYTSKRNLEKHIDSGGCDGISDPLMCPKCRTICASKYAKCRHMKTCNGSDPTLTHSQNIQQNAQVINNNNITLNYFAASQRVVPLGEENLTDFEDPAYLAARVREINGRGIYRMIEDIHFDDLRPENHNVRMHSRKRGMLKVMRPDGWRIECGKEVVTVLIAMYKSHLQAFLGKPEFRHLVVRNEGDLQQIQQDMLGFDSKSNPTYYFRCANKVLALIENLEIASAQQHNLEIEAPASSAVT
jgi:hypothetical protein